MTWPEHLNIDDFLLRDRLREAKGSRVALRLDRGDISYEDLDSAASGFARVLLDLGVEREDRVLLLLPDGLEYVAALFGVLRIGAVGVMLNPGLPDPATAGIVDLAEPSAVLVGDEYEPSFRRAVGLAAFDPPNVSIVRPGMELPDGHVDTVDTDATDPALWIFSGGTTGLPKAVVQTHRSFANTTRLYGQGTLSLSEDDVTIAVPKLYFGYAMGSNLFFPMSVGASAVLFPGPSTPGALFDRVERHRATVLINVPSAINQMLGAADSAVRDLSSLRLATSAGEALPDTLYRQWVDSFGVELLDGLGTAEMWHIFVSNVPDGVVPGTLGRVVPGFEIKAADDEGVPVDPGEVGRLWVHGESLGLGYWRNPGATAEAFRDGWFAGGDLVSIDASGLVTHRGRADDAVKIKGKWFRPQELESVLLEHECVAECAVVAIADDTGLPKPVAFVVAHDVTEDDLKSWSLDRLEPYKHPRRVIFLEELPRTHLGKVDRGALRGSA